MRSIIRQLVFLLPLLTLIACNQDDGPDTALASNYAPAIPSFSASPSRGTAPLAVSLRFRVTDRNNDTLTCSLDVDANGTPEYTLNPCSRGITLTQAHTYQSGASRARLTVSDGKGGITSKTVNLRIASAANASPTIAAFSASPASGALPLATTFSWTIADTNNDTLTCKLDTTGDGTPDYTLTPCTSSTTQAHTYNTDAGITAKLRVEDGKGGSAERTTTLTAGTPATVDLSIDKVELGQSVIKQNLRLVAGKASEVFAYILANQSGVSTSARAEVYSGSSLLGTINLTAPASIPTTGSSLTPANAFRGTLQANWVASNLQIKIIADPSNTLAETNESNNQTTLTPTIGKGTELPLMIVPVTYASQTATVPTYASLLTDLWPIKSTSAITRASYTFTGNLNTGTGWGNMLDAIDALRDLDRSNNLTGSRRYYYGYVKVSYSSGIAGIGYVGWPVSAGWNYSGSGPEVMAHELGHNFNQWHAPCGGPSGVDSSYPYTGASIGTWGISPTDGSLKDPAVYKDVMSYCDNAWISDYMYGKVQSYLETNVPNPASTAQPGNHLLVSGRIREGKVELRPLVRYQGFPAESRPGSYQFSLKGTKGTQTARFGTITSVAHGMSISEHAHHSGQPMPQIFEEYFKFSIPDVGNIEQLEVALDGVVQLSRTARTIAQADKLRLEERANNLQVTWNAAAYPYASLIHVSDGGERTTLSLWMEGGQQEVSLEGVSAGGRFEVQLSDGITAVVRQANPN
jgi:hypothetical protein